MFIILVFEDEGSYCSEGEDEELEGKGSGALGLAFDLYGFGRVSLKSLIVISEFDDEDNRFLGLLLLFC